MSKRCGPDRTASLDCGCKDTGVEFRGRAVIEFSVDCPCHGTGEWLARQCTCVWDYPGPSDDCPAHGRDPETGEW